MNIKFLDLGKTLATVANLGNEPAKDDLSLTLALSLGHVAFQIYTYTDTHTHMHIF